MNVSRALHPPPDRAPTLLAAALLLAGVAGVHAAAGGAAAARRLPDDQRAARRCPGASPETMASAVATPLERRFGRIAGLTEMTSASSLGSTNAHAAVRSGPRRRRGRARRAGGDQRRRRRAARQPADPPHLPEGEPGRRADPDPLAHAPTRCRSRRCSTPPTPCSRRRSRRCAGVGQVFVGGGQQPAVRVQVDPERARRRWGSALEDVRTALAQPTVEPAQGGARRADRRRRPSPPTISSSTPPPTAPLIVAYAERRAGAARRRGATSSTTSRTTASPAWIDGERAVLMIIRRQPGANIIEVDRPGQGAAARSSAASISPAIDVAGRDRPRARPSAPRCTTSSSRWCSACCWSSLVVFVFLRSARATAIPSVAVPLSLVGDVRRDVPARLQPRQPVADGADHLDRLRRRRRHRGHREHRPATSKPGEPPLQAALEGARQIGFTIVSITVSLLAVFIPLLLMGGIVGRLFREFAVTLSVAIAVSALVSLTLTPMMCSRLLRSRAAEAHGRLYRALRARLRGAARRLRPRAALGARATATLDAGRHRSPRSCSRVVPLRRSSPRASSRSRTPGMLAASPRRRRTSRSRP